MCKAPKPPEPKEPDKPEYLRNAYLDAAIGQSGMVQSLRQGRSGFRIDLGLGIGDRQPGESLVPSTPAAATTPDVAAYAPPTQVRPVGGRKTGRNRTELR